MEAVILELLRENQAVNHRHSLWLLNAAKVLAYSIAATICPVLLVYARTQFVRQAVPDGMPLMLRMEMVRRNS